MLDARERKLMRLASGLSDVLSERTYNLLLGACVLYGFVVNALIVWGCGDLFARINIWAFVVVYLVCCIVGVLITRSPDPVMSFIGYNFVVLPIGALTSVCLPGYGVDNILVAIVVTGVVALAMMVLASIYPRVFARLGGALFGSLILAVVAELAALLMGYPADIFNWLFVVIYSLYLGYDWYRAQSYPKTVDNAVDSALDIYLDIILLFMKLLRILGNDKD